MTPSHQYCSGRMIKHGKYFPKHPPFQVLTQMDPQPIFGQYILVSLPKHHFIGWFKKCTHKNVKNKIGKIYHPMEDIKSGRSHQKQCETDKNWVRYAQFLSWRKVSIPAHCADWWDWWHLPFWEWCGIWGSPRDAAPSPRVWGGLRWVGA